MRERVENNGWPPLLEAMGLPTDSRATSVSGGSIASSWQLAADERRWFLKLMPSGEPLAAEADGLRALAAAAGPRTPEVLGQGECQGRHWLLLEWLDLVPPGAVDWARLGEQLAAMHGAPAEGFGWWRDNFIGATPQPNAPLDDWGHFFGERRLRHQIELARNNGLGDGPVQRLERLCERVPSMVPATVRPSLLHGDLWSGNIAAADGAPVIFDPAVYRGHNEADLAMMELFGAPPADFWSAYRAHRAIEPGYAVRRDLYNLYHLLNHFNLFGGGYGGSADNVAGRLLAEVGG